jgi:UDP-glucuronate 4-epimerase
LKILLTGAAGFIGSHTAERLLTRGDEVVGLDDFNDYYSPILKRHNIACAQNLRGFTLIEGDIRDRDLVEKLFRNNRFDAVIHLAARAGVRPSLKQPALYEAANVQGLLNLLEASVHHGKPYFLFASSSSVYGVSPRLPWREDDPVDCPISPYAITKRSGELLCYSYWRTYGLKSCALRFFTVYGPRQRPEMAISKFFRATLQGHSVTVYGDGSAKRDFTYVDDIVDGLIAALDRPMEHQIINLGGAHTTTILELIHKIGEVVGRKPEIVFEPTQPGDVPATWADSAKAEQLLGKTPTTSLKDGLKAQLDWINQNQQILGLSRPIQEIPL